MQRALLPTVVCKRLDQINSNFISGGNADASRNPLFSWNKVCQPKTKGGLGLRQAKYYNLSGDAFEVGL